VRSIMTKPGARRHEFGLLNYGVGIFSYNKTNQMHKFLKFIFGIRRYMFRTVPLSWSCSQAVSKPVWHTPLLCVHRKTPDDRQRNCPKHVEFYSKNKFEKSVHLVGFIIRIYHDARSPERQNRNICQHLRVFEDWGLIGCYFRSKGK